MAQWVLVFTPQDVRAADIARLLSEQAATLAVLSADRDLLAVQRDREKVEVAEADAASLIREYDAGELVDVLAAVPNPRVFRVSYYHGTALLSEVLHLFLRLNQQVFIDNDYGTISLLRSALTQGLRQFLASRGS